eukprot:CAMPEP_0185546734 /NCGR_PEP_ID=MMETSP1381-20130426/5664_1 /TAXON_ID=298111 /ORGANISM="Pavlova sp., Strain CCMP459" /LENGTH=224 /DNA_ID=CAMNT_0028159205 /DNA_START=81 /DNA_END=751 /DNA_ORIENTATION=-
MTRFGFPIDVKSTRIALGRDEVPGTCEWNPVQSGGLCVEQNLRYAQRLPARRFSVTPPSVASQAPRCLGRPASAVGHVSTHRGWLMRSPVAGATPAPRRCPQPAEPAPAARVTQGQHRPHRVQVVKNLSTSKTVTMPSKRPPSSVMHSLSAWCLEKAAMTACSESVGLHATPSGGGGEPSAVDRGVWRSTGGNERANAKTRSSVSTFITTRLSTLSTTGSVLPP